MSESDQKASSGTPPLYPGSNNSSKVPSGSGSKTRRPSNSNAPSRSSTNESGEQHLDKHFRSILFHPLGLPLACALHGKDPGRLDYLRQESEYFPNNKQAYDNILGDVLAAWTTKAETDLTTSLTVSINANVNTLKAKREVKVGEGRVDILLRKDEESRPLMLVEVGVDGNDWWKKFDQCLKYLNMIQQAEPPLLLGVMTVDKSQKKTADKSQQQTTDKSENEPIEVKLGVFLCLWSGEEDNNNQKKLRISLLWHSKTCNRGDASKAFGRLLRGVCDFSWWIERVDSQRNDSQYEYFGSSCCRVGDMVLRSYDNRYRKTHRLPDIYLDENCQDIVGGKAEIIFKVPVDETSWNIVSNDFWELSGNRSLRVIATPFRHGGHFAKEPKSFLPIIDQLDMLHQKGYVHGDIRGFNTVFGDDWRQGYLIDFDFGGKAEDRVYPNGYRRDLRDGTRHGKGGNKIYKWHDWYALGHLIFDIHLLCEPNDESQSLQNLERKLSRTWKSLSKQPTPEMIDELKKFLSTIQVEGWTVEPSSKYQVELGEVDGGKPYKATQPCATGSPPGRQP